MSRHTAIHMEQPLATVLGAEVLDRLMPMHLRMAPDGHVVHVGPTLRKIAPEPLEGIPFPRLVEVLRPRGVQDLAGLRAADGGMVRLRLKGQEDVQLKGLCVPTMDGGSLLNLSFGYAVTAAVDAFDLTCGDFACTDLTIEMLYLIEAKSVAQEEQKKLNLRLQTDKRRAEAEALSDGLTGLANRRAFDAALQRHLDQGSSFAVMHVDLDFFKAVNDRLGHAAGDAVLTRVAQVLREEVRASDLVARVGGDEFTLLLGRFTDAAALLVAALRIIDRLEEPLTFGEEVCQISASIGVAIHPGGTTERTAAQILHEADVALYASKYRGRQQATMFAPGLEAEVAALAAQQDPGAR